MNVMLLLAQVASALTDSISGANPVLTQVNASDEMNLWSMAIKGGWIMVVLGLMSVLCFTSCLNVIMLSGRRGKKTLSSWIK